MIEAMISGVRWKLGELADRRIKASRKELYDALHGRLTDHHWCSGPGSIALSHAEGAVIGPQAGHRAAEQS
jgi:hypothetical protein